MTQPLDPDVLDFAHRMFECARNGQTGELIANIDSGLPVNLTNDKGDTLLMLAAYHARPDTVRGLLDRNADHTRINDRGQTALACAVFRKCSEAVEMLLAEGADPEAGEQSAIAVAKFFDLPDQLEILNRSS